MVPLNVFAVGSFVCDTEQETDEKGQEEGFWQRWESRGWPGRYQWPDYTACKLASRNYVLHICAVSIDHLKRWWKRQSVLKSIALCAYQDEDWGDDAVDWGEDVSESAVKQRMDEISGAARSMTLSDDLEKTQSERVNIFYEFVKV